MLGAYSILGLLLVPDIAIVLALLAVVGPPARPWIVTVAIVMALFGIAVGGFLISSTRTALACGVVADGEVLTVLPRAWPSYGQHGRVRVDLPGKGFEASYAWAGSAGVHPGERMRLLIDAKGDKVLLSLGPA